jgi:hypothetical protein
MCTTPENATREFVLTDPAASRIIRQALVRAQELVYKNESLKARNIILSLQAANLQAENARLRRQIAGMQGLVMN